MEFHNADESEFNSGLALIYQLDAIEKGLIEATLTNDYHLHYRMLVAYFKTLCNQLKDKEEELEKKHWDIVRKNYLELLDKERNGVRKVPLSLMETFDWWEIKLRNLKQKHGLGMPKKKFK